jgi:hypothetical protein
MSRWLCEDGSMNNELEARGGADLLEPEQFEPGHRVEGPLGLAYALRVRSAEGWLALGEADEALRELEALPRVAWRHPSAVKVRVTALGMLDVSAAALA